MFAGKTEELIRRARRVRASGVSCAGVLGAPLGARVVTRPAYVPGLCPGGGTARDGDGAGQGAGAGPGGARPGRGRATG